MQLLIACATWYLLWILFALNLVNKFVNICAAADKPRTWIKTKTKTAKTQQIFTYVISENFPKPRIKYVIKFPSLSAWHCVNKQRKTKHNPNEQNRTEQNTNNLLLYIHKYIYVLLVDYFVRSCDIKRQTTSTHFMLMRLVYPVNLC